MGLTKAKEIQYDSKNGQGKDFTWCQKDVEKEKSYCKLYIKTKKMYILKSYGNLMQNMTMSITENISASIDTYKTIRKKVTTAEIRDGNADGW